MTPHTTSFHPEANTIPAHVGIIPDGGRRWARAHGYTLQDAYAQSQKSMRTLSGLFYKHGVTEISIYLSSIQNFRRLPDEMDANLRIVGDAIDTDITAMAQEFNLQVKIVGIRQILPGWLIEKIDRIEKETSINKERRLNLLIAYNPVQEVIEAMQNGDPERFTERLWVTKPVDLIIRSGGASLLSNFLPLQSGFARLYFSDKLFNDLTPDDLKKILSDFSSLERKFGE
jgi:undecaprenyl diphosphate synthase